MQKNEALPGQSPSQPAKRQIGVAVLEAPQGYRNAQLEAMAESSPQMEKQSGLTAMMNASSAMAVQRELMEGIHNSPHQRVQEKFSGGIHNSLAVVSQRKKFESLFGTAQRVEEKYPLQGKLEIVQRVEEEEPLQGKFEALSIAPSQVLQMSKEKVANMVRTVKKLTEGLDNGTFAIGGSLALQMWYWALNPDKPLTREPGDIDLLLSDQEVSKPIGKKIIDQREGKLPEELKNGMVESFPSRFRGKQMTEEKYDGFGVDLKKAGRDSRWGAIDSLLMPIVDIQEEYSLPIQTPEALLKGLLKKYKALEGEDDERQKVAKDINVAQFVIKKFQWYQENA